jgi:hypothetical protein
MMPFHERFQLVRANHVVMFNDVCDVALELARKNGIEGTSGRKFFGVGQDMVVRQRRQLRTREPAPEPKQAGAREHGKQRSLGF